jgi:hypothetical protein
MLLYIMILFEECVFIWIKHLGLMFGDILVSTLDETNPEGSQSALAIIGPSAIALRLSPARLFMPPYTTPEEPTSFPNISTSIQLEHESRYQLQPRDRSSVSQLNHVRSRHACSLSHCGFGKRAPNCASNHLVHT